MRESLRRSVALDTSRKFCFFGKYKLSRRVLFFPQPSNRWHTLKIVVTVYTPVVIRSDLINHVIKEDGTEKISLFLLCRSRSFVYPDSFQYTRVELQYKKKTLDKTRWNTPNTKRNCVRRILNDVCFVFSHSFGKAKQIPAVLNKDSQLSHEAQFPKLVPQYRTQTMSFRGVRMMNF